MGGRRNTFLVWLTLFSMFSAIPTLHDFQAEQLPQSPIFHYDESNLRLLIYAPEKQQIDIELTPVDDAGKPLDRVRRERRRLDRGDNTLAFGVQVDENGHRVFFEVSGIEYEIWANRGEWFSLPKKMFVAESNIPTLNTGLSRPSDIQLAKGFGIKIKYKPEPDTRLSAVRTLGYPSSYGIKFDPTEYAFLLIAGGTVGPVRLTLGQRVESETLEYWDYYLVLEPRTRRYVIPFANFHPRGKATLALISINSITLDSLHPVDTGASISMSFVGLARPGPAIRTIAPSAKGYSVEIDGPIWHGAKIGYTNAQGKRFVKPINQNSVNLPPRAKKIWFCYEDAPPQFSSSRHRGTLGQVAEVCDPADAPLSNYHAPPRGKEKFVLDDFQSMAHVNAHRLPQVVFGSTTPVEHAMKFHHRKGALRVTYFPAKPDDYGGYISYFPTNTPSTYSALELHLRGPIPTDSVYVGVRDANNVEVKVLLQDYLKGERPPVCSEIAAALSGAERRTAFSVERAYCAEGSSSYLGLSKNRGIVGVKFKTVKIPLEAFRAISRNLYGKNYPRYKIQSVSLVMVYADPNTTHQVELGAVELTNETPSLSLCRFEGTKPNQNSLAGGIYSERARGTNLETQFDAEGYQGKGLKVTIASTRPEGYGLVGLILGNVNASTYRYLTFRVRGENGGEGVAIHLSDGKNKAIVQLKDYSEVQADWRKVKIPLTDFKKKDIDLANVHQVVLVWENAVMDQETIYFDDFVLDR